MTHDPVFCVLCRSGEDHECTACGTGFAEFLDPRPRHPSEPQGQYCRECAADKFDISDTPGGAS